MNTSVGKLDKLVKIKLLQKRKLQRAAVNNSSMKGVNTRMFHVVLSGEVLLRLANFLRPSELLSNRAK